MGAWNNVTDLYRIRAKKLIILNLRIQEYGKVTGQQ
jgi:hypothetical protein